LVLAILSLAPSIAAGQTESAFFYRGYAYGSQANYNPLSLMMNGSFDVLQSSNRDKKLFTLQYGTGASNVFSNITSPLAEISRDGWSNFLGTEIFPTSLDYQRSQYWPNYNLHLLGGGMTYVSIAEWYAFQGYEYPKTLSAATMLVYHYLNETVEDNAYRGPTVDPIADLLVFDPLGIALFSIDGVPRFFSQTLEMADWSFQPIYNFRTRELNNNGQNFTFKIPIPYSEKVRLLYIAGMEGVVGLSYRYNETDAISFGGGLATKDLVQVDNNTGVLVQTATLVKVGGIFYDRNNSLLASLIIKNVATYKARLNIYPGVFRFGDLSLGFVGILQQDNSLTLGAFASFSPLGAGFSSAK